MADSDLGFGGKNCRSKVDLKFNPPEREGDPAMETKRIELDKQLLTNITHLVLLASFEINRSLAASPDISENVKIESSDKKKQPRASDYRFEDEIKNFLDFDDEFLMGTWAEWQPLMK